MIDRRTFLATPLVFGLRDLLEAQQPRDGRPAWWTAALDRMKSTGRCGVVLVAPSGPFRQPFGEQLAALLPSADPAVRRVLGQAVFIVVDPSLAGGLVRTEGEICNRILLAPDGRRIAADTLPVMVYSRPDLFAASFRPFVEGPDGARLAERATALEPSFPDDAKRALEGLRSDAPAVREAAAAELLRRADAYYPLLLHRAGTEGDVDVRARLAQILDRVVLQSDPRLSGPTLPYGVRRIAAEPELPRGAGCGPCGLVVITAPARDFLDCLLK